ncbi:MAG: rod-binding protein [Rickettsiales bacterium]|nr:rod-binding protein [Rickettsiales bacterium]
MATINASVAAGLYVGSLDTKTQANATASAALSSRGKGMNMEQIDKAAKDFESMFISQMLEPMFGESLGKDLFGDSETNDVYKSFMVKEYGQRIVDAGGIGIAGYVKTALLKLQEVGHDG